MPRINIYIRNEDLEAWESIHDKPTFLHNAIQMREDYLELSPKEKRVVKEEIAKIPTKVSTVLSRKEVVEKIKKDVAKIKPLTEAQRLKIVEKETLRQRLEKK